VKALPNHITQRFALQTERRKTIRRSITRKYRPFCVHTLIPLQAALPVFVPHLRGKNKKYDKTERLFDAPMRLDVVQSLNGPPTYEHHTSRDLKE